MLSWRLLRPYCVSLLKLIGLMDEDSDQNNQGHGRKSKRRTRIVPNRSPIIIALQLLVPLIASEQTYDNANSKRHIPKGHEYEPRVFSIRYECNSHDSPKPAADPYALTLARLAAKP